MTTLRSGISLEARTSEKSTAKGGPVPVLSASEAGAGGKRGH
jgi:hypothetical protein